jgi:formate-dependent nitrite reductase membrane component NrfD
MRHTAEEPAAPRAPYGRHRTTEIGGVPTDTAVPTYYGLPAVKKSHYGWLISSYFFIGGLAGAAQLIATLFDRAGRADDRPVVRCGRYVALLGATIGPLLLIRDLHTSRRWYNMLRIVRPTSPMSIGSWTLALFGAFSGLTATAQVMDDLGIRVFRRVASVTGVPAAGLGMVMSIYTGVLLSATSTPLWVTAYRQLPPLFGATAFASATAALSLMLGAIGAPRSAVRRLDLLGLIAAVAQLFLSISVDREWQARGVDAPVAEGRLGMAHRGVAFGLGIVVPLVLNALQLVLQPRTQRLSLLSATAALTGAYAERAVIVFAGNQSAERAEDYFRNAQQEAP